MLIGLVGKNLHDLQFYTILGVDLVFYVLSEDQGDGECR